VDNGDGSYEFSIVFDRAGSYNLSMEASGKPIASSPYAIVVTNIPSAAPSTDVAVR
jgi:hypothetical protein